MKSIITLGKLLIAASILTFSISCKKDFLEAKPSTSLLLLRTITDCQQLLNNTTVLNQTGSLPIAAADEYEVPDYITYQAFERQSTKNSYIWAKNLYAGDKPITDWNIPYSAVFYANSVLDALNSIKGAGSSEWNKTKGWALFARAFAYYDLSQNFCSTYDPQTATSDMGLPLRLKPGIDELLARSNLKTTYQQILHDLDLAGKLLSNPLSTDFRNQPSKAACFALLARINLSMRSYGLAEAYADSCLSITATLIDYNTISLTDNNPFGFSNAETIYQSTQITDYSEVTNSSEGTYGITTELLELYSADDLRSSIFFTSAANGLTIMKRGYSGRADGFSGLAVDEVYLIKAECAARRSAVNTALSFLNDLLVKRYKTGSFQPHVTTSRDEALTLVLTERRKELIRRGLRWSDLKRLNKEGKNTALTRNLNGQTYTLPANDPRYIFPIPDEEISYSGIAQNIR